LQLIASNKNKKILNSLNSFNSNLNNITIINANTSQIPITTLIKENITSVLKVGLSINSKVNLYAPSIVCWEGTYYIHAIFSIIVSIFFVIVCLFIVMTYFETKSSTHNQSAKANSKADVFVLISKVLILLLFNFFEESNNQWVLIAVTFFLSAYIFFTFYEEMPYYNNRLMKVINNVLLSLN